MKKKPVKPEARPHPSPLPQEREKKKRGRPAVITAAVVERVGELMALGVPEDYACEMAGVNPATFGPAVSRSEAFKGLMRKHHARFMAESLELIRDGGERVQLADGVDKAGEPVTREERIPWTGRAWILERRYKPHFNRTEHVAAAKSAEGGVLTEAEMLDIERIVKGKVLRRRVVPSEQTARRAW